jgi:hypothetical protein
MSPSCFCLMNTDDGFIVLVSSFSLESFYLESLHTNAFEWFTCYIAKDVPGGNDIGHIVNDEELFASEFVTYVCQFIGVGVANTYEKAKIASKNCCWG